MIIVGILIAGGLGALCRYLVDIGVTAKFGHKFPWGTLVINVTGSALLGFIAGLALYRGFPSTPEAILGTGFCGGYTTFSTHMVDSVKLRAAGQGSTVIVNVVVTFVLSTAGAALGLALAAL